MKKKYHKIILPFTQGYMEKFNLKKNVGVSFEV